MFSPLFDDGVSRTRYCNRSRTNHESPREKSSHRSGAHGGDGTQDIRDGELVFVEQRVLRELAHARRVPRV